MLTQKRHFCRICVSRFAATIFKLSFSCSTLKQRSPHLEVECVREESKATVAKRRGGGGGGGGDGQEQDRTLHPVNSLLL